LIWNFWLAGTVNSEGMNLWLLSVRATGSAIAMPLALIEIKAAMVKARVIATLRIVLIFIDNDIGSHYQQGPPAKVLLDR
jgi:hypothetical protein